MYVCVLGNIYQRDRIPHTSMRICVCVCLRRVYSALIMRPLTLAFVYHVSLFFFCLRRVARRDASNSFRVQQRSLGRDFCLFYLRVRHGTRFSVCVCVSVSNQPGARGTRSVTRSLF